MEGAYQISKAEGLAQYVALQNHHSYLQPRPEVDWGDNVVMDNEHFDFARNRGVRLLTYYSLLKGTYARADRPLWASYDTQANRQRLERLKVVADDLGVTLHQACAGLDAPPGPGSPADHHSQPKSASAGKSRRVGSGDRPGANGFPEFHRYRHPLSGGMIKMINGWIFQPFFL